MKWRHRHRQNGPEHRRRGIWLPGGSAAARHISIIIMPKQNAAGLNNRQSKPQNTNNRASHHFPAPEAASASRAGIKLTEA